MGRYKVFLLMLACVGILTGCTKKDPDLSQYVNPFIGTGGHGHTFPGATLPFGMVQLSPDTRLEGWDGCSGYHYSDSIVYGFSHTHLSGTGVGDYCDVLFMPTTGDIAFNNGYKKGVDQGYASRFLKKTEKASPGQYQVILEDYNIAVSLTATERTGMHLYNFGESSAGNVIIDLAHRDIVLDASIEQVSETAIQGFRKSKSWADDQRVYFYTEFSKPFSQVQKDSTGQKLALEFEQPSELLIKVGISPVSCENAKENLLKENPEWDFNKTKTAAKNAWNEQLKKVQIEGGTKDQKATFYTSLYHSFIAPNLFSDTNGEYRGMDGKNHQADNTKVYTVFSLWDTFRATHPLFTILEQKRTNEFIRTALDHHEKGGLLPVWELGGNETFCMIGYHCIPVIADAYAKGIREYDTDKALAAMKHSANQNHFGLEAYKEKGFIDTGDEPESASKTLEYAYDDWCISEMARLMGKKEEQEVFAKRGQSFRNLFNPQTGFFQARMNGGWFSPFDPAEVNFNYTEANAWQYTFFVPQDIPGMIDLVGGNDAFEKHLDNLFTANKSLSGREQVDITGLIGQYAHGNEPSHHMAYLYNYIGKPWKSQQRSREIMDKMYSNQPDGLSGNEDCGQMSAWYVLSAMGIYPVTPGLTYYAIGSPLFEKATLNLENGNKFSIKAQNVSAENKYIQSASLNGEPYSNSFLEHKAIMAGGILELNMGPEPNKNWAAEESNWPYAPEKSIEIVPVPYIEASSKTFTDSLSIKLGAACKDCKILYAMDGSSPTGSGVVFDSPISISETTRIRAVAENSNGEQSREITNEFLKIDKNKSITLHSEYANQYAAGGDKALIDQLRGNNNYRTGYWQGYQGQDVEAVVDLGSTKQINRISMGFLQDIRSWIWYPTQVEFLISTDGMHFSQAGIVQNNFPDDKEGAYIQDLGIAVNKKARYITAIAKNYGPCPKWHLGAGGRTWIFSDEIIVE